MKPYQSRFLSFCGALWLFLSGCAFAETTETGSHWSVGLGIGLGIRTNPVAGNSDIPLILIPQVSYQGEHFFLQNLDIGYNLFEQGDQQLNVLITPSYDQVFFNRWDANNFVSNSQGFANLKTENYPTVEDPNKKIQLNHLHERRMAALAGLEYLASYNSVDIQVQALHEATGYYGGDELRVALSKNISAGKNDIKLTLGANWQSAKTLNYFYGVREQESTTNFFYEPSAGTTSLLRLDWNYQINSAWSLRFFSSYRHLSHSITQSPLIIKDNVITAFAGGVYHF